MKVDGAKNSRPHRRPTGWPPTRRTDGNPIRPTRTTTLLLTTSSRPILGPARHRNAPSAPPSRASAPIRTTEGAAATTVASAHSSSDGSSRLCPRSPADAPDRAAGADPRAWSDATEALPCPSDRRLSEPYRARANSRPAAYAPTRCSRSRCRVLTTRAKARREREHAQAGDPRRAVGTATNVTGADTRPNRPRHPPRDPRPRHHPRDPRPRHHPRDPRPRHPPRDPRPRHHPRDPRPRHPPRDPRPRHPPRDPRSRQHPRDSRPRHHPRDSRPRQTPATLDRGKPPRRSTAEIPRSRRPRKSLAAPTNGNPSQPPTAEGHGDARPWQTRETATSRVLACAARDPLRRVNANGVSAQMGGLRRDVAECSSASESERRTPAERRAPPPTRSGG